MVHLSPPYGGRGGRPPLTPNGLSWEHTAMTPLRCFEEVTRQFIMRIVKSSLLGRSQQQTCLKIHMGEHSVRK